MRRRDFGKLLFGGLIGATVLPVWTTRRAFAAGGAGSMVVTEDHWDLFTPEHVDYLLRHGVTHLEVEHIERSEIGEWNLDYLKKIRDLADDNGLTITMLNQTKILQSDDWGKRVNHIVRGTPDERDREIEVIQGNIAKAAAIGVPAIRYHWRMTNDYRNHTVVGPGGNRFIAWRLPDDWRSLPVGEAGEIPIAKFWQNTGTFLERVMPVAEECGITVACHPPDPPLPPGFRGVDTWDYDMFSGLKTYAALTDSPNFGFLLCIGTVAEGLLDPTNDEVLDIIRHFGERGMIHTVHLRNIRGRRDDFSEWYPDSGDTDFVKVMKVLREVGYAGPVLPDHMPSTPVHDDDPDRKQAFAFGFGYIKGLIQAVNAG